MSIAAASTPEWQQLGFRPGAVMRLFGMRRSGNHAIASWLQRNAANGHALFLNNCTARRDPLKTYGTVELDCHRISVATVQKDMQAVGARAGDGALLLMSYEDTIPDDGARRKPVSGPFSAALIDHNILIYRSFLNWLASLTRKLQLNEVMTVTSRASQLLRAVNLYRSKLECVIAHAGTETVPICYDRWVEDPAYRAERLSALGLPLRDNGLGAVQAYGGGSSFQKNAEHADMLKVAERHSDMIDDAEYQSILALSSRDTALCDALAQCFPRDRDVLDQVRGGGSLPMGATA